MGRQQFGHDPGRVGAIRQPAAGPYARIRQADLDFDAGVEELPCATAAEALVCYFRQQGDRPALPAVEDLLRQTEDFDWQDLGVGLVTGRFPTPDGYFDYGACGHFRLPPEMRGDSGFAPQYRDPWPGSRDQVGHFLSILDMALRYERSAFPYNRFMLWATVGHELVPDTWGQIPQVTAGFLKEVQALASRGQTLYHVFMYGDNDDLRWLLTSPLPLIGRWVPPLDKRAGNSMADLLLSRKAFELATLLLNPESPLQTSEDVANWMQAHLLTQNEE